MEKERKVKGKEGISRLPIRQLSKKIQSVSNQITSLLLAESVMLREEDISNS